MITYQRFMLYAKLQKSTFHAHGEIDHEHCVMCGAKFSEAPVDLQEGYVTWNRDHWVCPDCLNDFRDEYHWTLNDL